MSAGAVEVLLVDFVMARMLIDIFTRSMYEMKHAANSITPTFNRAGIFAAIRLSKTNPRNDYFNFFFRIFIKKYIEKFQSPKNSPMDDKEMERITH